MACVSGINSVTVLDFTRSYVTFFTTPAQGGNIARIQVDATCSVDGWGDNGQPGRFHLIAPCRSEHMYLDGQLFQMPNYEFCGIFTDDDLVLLRTHWTSDQESPEIARATDRFDQVAIDRVDMHAERLFTTEDIVDATLANRRLVARTRLTDPGSGSTAVLEYPIKTMNVTTSPLQFQVDTGPIIVPRFDAAEQPPIGRFDIAHIVYCAEDRAEFILRRPHDVGQRDGRPVQVTDYSELRFETADNEIWGEAT